VTPHLPLSRFHWADPDRRELYRALLLLTSPKATAERLEVGLHTLLVHLEIYDDPRQGVSWLSPDELALVDRLGEALQGLVADAPQGRWGVRALNHIGWSDARSAAMALQQMIEGAGTRPIVAASRPTPA
jgi:hypothetical protein